MYKTQNILQFGIEEVKKNTNSATSSVDSLFLDDIFGSLLKTQDNTPLKFLVSCSPSLEKMMVAAS